MRFKKVPTPPRGRVRELDAAARRRYSARAMVMTLLLHGRHIVLPPTAASAASAPVVYQPFGPWLVPWRIGSFDEEYAALRSGAGLIDYSTQALIEVGGADRVGFLHGLLTNDIKRLVPGAGCQAALLDASAKVTALVLVSAEPDALWLMCDVDQASVVVATLERYVFSEHVTITNHERRWAVFALQGPRTPELLSTVRGSDGLREPGDHLTLLVDGRALRFVRHELAGGSGVLCLVAADDARAAWEHLLRWGRPAGLMPVGWEALNTARIEAGVPWPAIDVTDANLLPETGLETMLASDTKGCYLGQEIIARLTTYGSVSRKLMGLRIEAQQVPPVGSRLCSDDQDVGWVSSACRSPALRQSVALGYLKRGWYEPGVRVDVLHGDARLPAIVARRPLLT